MKTAFKTFITIFLAGLSYQVSAEGLDLLQDYETVVYSVIERSEGFKHPVFELQNKKNDFSSEVNFSFATMQNAVFGKDLFVLSNCKDCGGTIDWKEGSGWLLLEHIKLTKVNELFRDSLYRMIMAHELGHYMIDHIAEHIPMTMVIDPIGCNSLKSYEEIDGSNWNDQGRLAGLCHSRIDIAGLTILKKSGLPGPTVEEIDLMFEIMEIDLVEVEQGAFLQYLKRHNKIRKSVLTHFRKKLWE